MDGLLIFLAFELYYSLFHILMIKSSNRVDRALFNFLFNSFENSLIVIVCFGHKDMNKLQKKFCFKFIRLLILVEKAIHIFSFDTVL